MYLEPVHLREERCSSITVSEVSLKVEHRVYVQVINDQYLSSGETNPHTLQTYRRGRTGLIRILFGVF